MRKGFFNVMLLVLLVPLSMLWGCGGGGGSAAPQTPAKTAAVSGTVSFPQLGSVVAKRLQATAPTPVLTITDLAGNVVASPKLTVDSSDPKKFTYSVTLDPAKNYVFKATWSGQVIKSVADESTLSPLAATVDLTPVTTAAVLVVEKKLNLASGQLGTPAASTVTSTDLGAVKPAVLIATVTAEQTTTYATLVTEVTTALSQATPVDPATVVQAATITTAASSYTPPPSFTSAMISGKSMKSASGTAFVFKADGTFLTTKNTNTNVWVLNPDGTILITYTGQTSGWDKISLVQNNSSTLEISDTNIDGSTSTSTWSFLSSIAVTPSAPTANVGGTQQFTATGTYSDDSTKDLTSFATWSSSSNSLATVSASGLATAVGAGSATITAQSGSISGTATFAVSAPQPNAIQTALQAGIYGIDNDTFGTNSTELFSYEVISSSSTQMSQVRYYLTAASPTWSTTAPSGYDTTGGYRLTSTGWQVEPSGPNGFGIVFNSDGSATMTNSVDGSQSRLTATATDISGQTIAAGYAANYQEWPLSSTSATFPTGSVRYNFVETHLTGSYDLWYHWGPVSSLASVPSSLQALFIDSDSTSTNYYCAFASVTSSTTGTATVYAQTGSGAPVSLGTVPWVVSTVSGQSILEVQIPEAMHNQYHFGGNPIVAIINGNAWIGGRYLPNLVDYSGGGAMLNATAFNFLKSQFSLGQGSVTATW